MGVRPIKIACVEYIKRYLTEIIATNKRMVEFNSRPLKEKISVVNGRLVDQHEEMLNKWREKGVHGAISPLPTFLMGFDKNYTSSDLTKGRSISSKEYIVQDEQGDYFKIRVSKHDIRMQLVLYAPDVETAFSFADQFKLFCARFENRHAYAKYKYNNRYYGFAMTLEDNNVVAVDSPIPEQDNLTVYVMDLTFSCNTPYFVGYEPTGAPYLPVVNAIYLTSFDYQTGEDIYNQLIIGKQPKTTTNEE